MGKGRKKFSHGDKGIEYAGVPFGICPKCLKPHHLYYTAKGLRCKNCTGR